MNIGKTFGTIKVLRSAHLTDLARFKPKLVQSVNDMGVIRRTPGNRHKYWLTFCTACRRAYLLRSDKIPGKVCRCQRVKKAPDLD